MPFGSDALAGNCALNVGRISRKSSDHTARAPPGAASGACSARTSARVVPHVENFSARSERGSWMAVLQCVHQRLMPARTTTTSYLTEEKKSKFELRRCPRRRTARCRHPRSRYLTAAASLRRSSLHWLRRTQRRAASRGRRRRSPRWAAAMPRRS